MLCQTHRRRQPAGELRDLPAGAGLAASMRALSAGMLVAAAEVNRAVYVSTPNTETELRVTLGLGADGVITDRPDLALDLRRRLFTGD